MSLWKILTGKVNETKEAIEDSQATTILDQNIREASDALIKAKQALAQVMGEKKLNDDKMSKLKAKIAEREAQALALLEKGDEATATEVADRIAKLEAELAPLAAHGEALEKNVTSLRRTVQQTDGQLANLKRQVDIVKATDSVQKAQLSVNDKVSGVSNSMNSVQGTLDRIQKKQAANAARLEAAADLAGGGEDDLDAKINKSLGNEASGSSVLARLKAQKKD